jgi:hypothetical protein
MDIENLIGTTASVPILDSNENIKHISLSFFTDALNNLKGISGFSETEFKISQIIANILDALVNFFINKDGEIFFFSVCFIVIFMTIALTGVFVGLTFHFFKRPKPEYNNVTEESFYNSALDEFLKPSAPPLRNGNLKKKLLMLYCSCLFF